MIVDVIYNNKRILKNRNILQWLTQAPNVAAEFIFWLQEMCSLLPPIGWNRNFEYLMSVVQATSIPVRSQRRRQRSTQSQVFKCLHTVKAVKYHLYQDITQLSYPCWVVVAQSVFQRAGRLGFECRQGQHFSLLHCIHTGFIANPSSCLMGNTRCFPEVKVAGGVKLSTHLHLVPRSIILSNKPNPMSSCHSA
jgi:hypothetical protein